MPPMLMIAAMFLLLFANQGFGLLGGNVVVKVFNFASLVTWIIVGGIASLAAIADAVRNLIRFGITGVTRPRLWFELSRLTFITLLFVALSIPLVHVAGGAGLRQIRDALPVVASLLLAAFIAFSSVGYLLSIATGKTRRGRAFECVQYFFVLQLVSFTLAFPLAWLPDRVAWFNGAVVGWCIAGVAVTAAVVLKLRERRNHMATDGLGIAILKAIRKEFGELHNESELSQ